MTPTESDGVRSEPERRGKVDGASGIRAANLDRGVDGAHGDGGGVVESGAHRLVERRAPEGGEIRGFVDGGLEPAQVFRRKTSGRVERMVVSEGDSPRGNVCLRENGPCLLRCRDYSRLWSLMEGYPVEESGRGGRAGGAPHQ